MNYSNSLVVAMSFGKGPEGVGDQWYMGENGVGEQVGLRTGLLPMRMRMGIH